MAKSFNNLLKTLPQERRDRINERAQAMLLEMALQDLRQKRHLTQQQLVFCPASFEEKAPPAATRHVGVPNASF